MKIARFEGKNGKPSIAIHPANVAYVVPPASPTEPATVVLVSGHELNIYASYEETVRKLDIALNSTMV